MTRSAVFAPFEVIEGDRARASCCSPTTRGASCPDEYGDLGLPPSEFDRHIAYDIGVEALTRRLAERPARRR